MPQCSRGARSRCGWVGAHLWSSPIPPAPPASRLLWRPHIAPLSLRHGRVLGSGKGRSAHMPSAKTALESCRICAGHSSTPHLPPGNAPTLARHRCCPRSWHTVCLWRAFPPPGWLPALFDRVFAARHALSASQGQRCAIPWCAGQRTVLWLWTVAKSQRSQRR